MAIQLNYYDANLEVTVENCYYRIEKIEAYKNSTGNYNADVWVYIYKNKEKAQQLIVLNSRMYYFENLTADELTIEGLYDRLKKLDDFKDAIDV